MSFLELLCLDSTVKYQYRYSFNNPWNSNLPLKKFLTSCDVNSILNKHNDLFNTYTGRGVYGSETWSLCLSVTPRKIFAVENIWA